MKLVNILDFIRTSEERFKWIDMFAKSGPGLMQSKDLRKVLGTSPTGMPFASEAEVLLRGDGEAWHLENLILQLIDG